MNELNTMLNKENKLNYSIGFFSAICRFEDLIREKLHRCGGGLPVNIIDDCDIDSIVEDLYSEIDSDDMKVILGQMEMSVKRLREQRNER